MNFEDAYEKLKEEFKQKIKEDGARGIDSIFLPNIAPAAPVDYILIGMEPSLGNWARDNDPAQRRVIAQKRIDAGFRNFCGVWTLHHPVREYLCRKGETYYCTDLAKGAMLTSSLAAGDEKKYKDWYPLLENEIGLVAKPGAKVISIGHRVARFLSEKGLYAHAGTIPHYSAQAARHWGREQCSREVDYEDFKVRLHSIPNSTCMPGHVCRPAPKSQDVLLKDPRKKLLFDYKIRFERIRSQETSGWKERQREWESLNR